MERRVERLLMLSSQAGVAVTHEQGILLLKHLSLVLQANKHQNLTRISDPDDAVVSHIVDALSCVPLLRALPGYRSDRTLVDLGSGAGFPGIPVAVLCGLVVTLVESNGKKAAFLRTACEELGLSARVRVFDGRAEELARQDVRRFDYVTARALASLPSLVELSSPLLAVGGSLLCMKGVPAEAECAAGSKVAGLVGLEEADTHSFSLPETGHARTIVRYRKISSSSRPLPRRNGMAQRRPLA